MFEPMTGAAAHQPHVLVVWMAINQKVSIPSVFILTHTRFQDRRILKPGNMACKKLTQTCYSFGHHQTFVVVRIDGGAVPVKSYFEAAPLDIRESIRDVSVLVMEPDRHIWRPEAA